MAKQVKPKLSKYTEEVTPPPPRAFPLSRSNTLNPPSHFPPSAYLDSSTLIGGEGIPEAQRWLHASSRKSRHKTLCYVEIKKKSCDGVSLSHYVLRYEYVARVKSNADSSTQIYAERAEIAYMGVDEEGCNKCRAGQVSRDIITNFACTASDVYNH